MNKYSTFKVVSLLIIAIVAGTLYYLAIQQYQESKKIKQNKMNTSSQEKR